ncbi:MAG: flagellar basal body-associated protein FliL [Acidimicrobiia bacterium]
MAGKKSTSATDDSGAAPKKSKGKLLMTIALCLGLAGAGYVLGGRKAAAGTETAAAADGSGHAEADGSVATTEVAGECAIEEEPPELGMVIDLPSMSVNLAEGHYLRVALSVALAPDVELEKPEEFKGAPAKDIVVSILSGRTIVELSSAAGRDQVKTELTEQIVEAYHGEVDSVFLTEFVMQ